MQSYSLTVDKFLDHAAKWHPQAFVAGHADDGMVATGYSVLRERANRMSGALASLGIEPGQRVATLAWNTLNHFEFYFAVMGAGMVCHTLNPRLVTAQLAAMITEADDRVLAVSVDLLDIARELRAKCPCLEQLVVLDGNVDPQAHGNGVGQVWDFETLLQRNGANHPWGVFDENCAAGLCYTSGTTGRPKGVVYTHRSNYLHTLRALQADALGITSRDIVLPAVPMFHANGWGIPFAAPAVGASVVLPGRHLDGASLARLLTEYEVTVAVGVQTVWLALADHTEATGEQFPSLRRVLVGGSTCPDALRLRLEQQLGVEIQTSWGMTELSPIGTIAAPGAPGPDGSSGRPAFGLDLKLTDASGQTLATQRNQLGHLKVRGHSVVDRYFGERDDALDGDGYFDTGDLAILDDAGNLTIGGRSKDLIKSGGEWINPTEIETVIGMHPSVRHVAVIGRPDARWGERPVAIVEADDLADDPVKLLGLLKGKVADWWIPDEILSIPSMPLAASGKIDKQSLRAQFASDQ
ncbi:AMP-binding protein [Porphyrobacter algicida]|uniref:AMP-binding protein n=1 Tax=Qipengyuania algicida TaxID=1836209 RepID=A0A845AJ28_9SPHN|nr:AMP-binding protein [Qipengyuania algicida]MXP29614.1 AMP-binding protein [Qipengyuania algicida]